jgi:hypothetical protein
VQTLGDTIDALAVAEKLQAESADLIDAGHHSEAMEKLNEGLTVWVNVERAVSLSAQAMGWDIELVTVDQTRLRDAVDRLNERLQLLRNALETKDPVGISDVLRYDLPETVREWQAILTGLVTRAGEGDA